MNNEEAARILDPETSWEALRECGSNYMEVIAAVKEAFTTAAKVLRNTAWISVKDRLPEQDGWYLVYAPGYWGNSRIYGLDGMAYSNFKNNYKDHWGIERGISRGGAVIVTHWMPLPEPPKED